MSSLAGKTALVTGGSRGIGAAIVRRLAGAGAHVAFTYATSREKADALVAEIGNAGGTAIALQADNRDVEAVEAAVREAAGRLGRIDILVNNAGVLQAGPVSELGMDAYETTMAINVRAAYAAVLAAEPHLPDGARLIFTGSNIAQRVPGPGMTLYAMSKAALTGLAKGLARDYGGRNITANIVHPGSTDTDMNPAQGDFADAQRQGMAISRFSEPDDVAAMVAWLAGPDARSVTGAELVVDNGTNA